MAKDSIEPDSDKKQVNPKARKRKTSDKPTSYSIEKFLEGIKSPLKVIKKDPKDEPQKKSKRAKDTNLHIMSIQHFLQPTRNLLIYNIEASNIKKPQEVKESTKENKDKMLERKKHKNQQRCILHK